MAAPFAPFVSSLGGEAETRVQETADDAALSKMCVRARGLRVAAARWAAQHARGVRAGLASPHSHLAPPPAAAAPSHARAAPPSAWATSTTRS